MMLAKVGVPGTLVGMVLLLACPKSGEELPTDGAGGTQSSGVAGSGSPDGTAGTAGTAAGGTGGGGTGGSAATNGGAGGTASTLTGSFRGDQDVIGTWDVTVEAGNDTHDCSATIADNLDFVINCLERGSTDEFEEGCDDHRIQRISGSINGLTGAVELHSVDRYSGSGCPGYGFEVDREYPDQTEMDGELTRTEAGVGTVGGTWTAQVFEWDCGDCLTEDAPMSRDNPYDCDFELNEQGAIQVACIETSGDCNSEYAGLGNIADGNVDVDMTERRVGAGCDEEQAADELVISIQAVRR